METKLTQEAKKVKFTALSRTQMAKVFGGDMTPKERCEFNNVGYCGACDKDGRFVACAYTE